MSDNILCNKCINYIRVTKEGDNYPFLKCDAPYYLMTNFQKRSEYVNNIINGTSKQCRWFKGKK